MDRLRLGFVLLVAGMLAASSTPVDAAKKIKERRTQLSFTFVNDTEQTVYGLVVKLSGASIVATDDDNMAGPFRNVNGNDTTSIVLSNPDAPVSAGASAEVLFRSYKNSAKVKSYWWTDLRGKRVGAKKKA